MARGRERKVEGGEEREVVEESEVKEVGDVNCVRGPWIGADDGSVDEPMMASRSVLLFSAPAAIRILLQRSEEKSANALTEP